MKKKSRKIGKKGSKLQNKISKKCKKNNFEIISSTWHVNFEHRFYPLKFLRV